MALKRSPGIVAVCGRLWERHPERSVYIHIFDIGWEQTNGEIVACGKVAMYRVAQYAAAGGFKEELIAGDEFELCCRLRAAGGRVVRISADIAWHDLGITKFGQWWRRAMRVGYGYAEASVLYTHGNGVSYLVARLAARQRRLGRKLRDAPAFGLFLTLGKVSEACGAAKYRLGRILHRRQRIIEYR